jgi:glycosyltransferase involved in cell wall biosynthesis
MPDLAIVMPPATGAGWILDGFCSELASRSGYPQVVALRSGEPLPAARRYFFAHCAYTLRYLYPCSPVYSRPVAVFATHLEPAKSGLSAASIAALTRIGPRLICMNEELRATLENAGAAQQALHVVVGAADPARFPSHVRTATGRVGLCSSFYLRKGPDLVLEIVRRMPHREFLLLGRGWAGWQRFKDLAALPNFEYVEADYSEYASHYARMSVFVSVSLLEGGPIPLLEAMMSNVVPVVSCTGFAPDVIRHGANGFLFRPGAHADEIGTLVDRAFTLDADVSATARMYDWDRFAHGVRRVLDMPDERSQPLATDAG